MMLHRHFEAKKSEKKTKKEEPFVSEVVQPDEKVEEVPKKKAGRPKKT